MSIYLKYRIYKFRPIYAGDLVFWCAVLAAWQLGCLSVAIWWFTK